MDSSPNLTPPVKLPIHLNPPLVPLKCQMSTTLSATRHLDISFAGTLDIPEFSPFLPNSQLLQVLKDWSKVVLS